MMFIFIRLYRFHRKCGMARRRAARRALASALQDFNLKGPTL